MAFYTAAKSRSAGRTGWSISFRHPLRTDIDGKAGLKVRRGLGTADELVADRLVAEMNVLLQDQRYWAVTAKSLAAERFSPVVVDAFYTGLEVPMSSDLELRDESIPLPSVNEGYARVLLVGTTGAGKTTLLRHLIGSDPKTDRFPSTSTGRTTTADIEVVTADGDYQAVVTFLPERAIRTNVRECIDQAVLAAWNRASDEDICRQLLHHPDQIFRLNYTLGSWVAEDSDDEEGWTFETEKTAEAIDEDDLPTNIERSESRIRLAEFIASVKSLAKTAGEHVVKELGVEWSTLKGTDLDAAEAWLAESAIENAAYNELVDKIIFEIKKRFEPLAGDLARDTTGWPVKWSYQSSERSAFLRRVRWFSSNYAPQFGRLLTPLVRGIRVRGPFFPKLGCVPQPKLVLVDGQGLGHTVDTSSSITTHITSRFGQVDVILLVDSAQQPMQAASLAVIRAVAIGGHQDKLLIAFYPF